ncbi:MAG: permease [SAR324 cluster bacterium]|nr:permease [SAR324 cluster bacterium]
MFQIFTDLATEAVKLIGLDLESRLGASVHFFIEDVSKIMVLLVVMIYLIALVRASLNLERVRDFLQRIHPVLGYGFGAIFGAITPFCSCSSIPLFLGFTTARIPVGISLAFLITSPMINEVAIVLLGSLLGFRFTLVYVAVGLLVGMASGALLDLLKAERYLKPFLKDALNKAAETITEGPVLPTETPSLSLQERHEYAKDELYTIMKRIWKWVFIGIGVGAIFHGFVPESWVTGNLGAGQWWSVPAAVFVGIPLYSNATGMIPIMESLILKGLPIGTTLAFSMSVIAASFPEFILLKQVMEWRLLAMLWVTLLCAFTLVGWFFNAFWPIISQL